MEKEERRRIDRKIDRAIKRARDRQKVYVGYERLKVKFTSPRKQVWKYERNF